MRNRKPQAITGHVWEEGSLRRDVVGQRVHRAIEIALETGKKDRRSLDRVVRRFGGGDGRAARLMSPRQLVVTLAGVYLSRLALLDPWAVFGSEVSIGACRFDVVWRHNSGSVLVDEIKTGSATIEMPEVRSQLERYRLAGVAEWGELFAGVRLCPLRSPSAAAVLVADGTLTGGLHILGGVS